MNINIKNLNLSRVRKHIQACCMESSQFWIRGMALRVGMCSEIFFNASTFFSQQHSERESAQQPPMHPIHAQKHAYQNSRWLSDRAWLYRE